MFREAASFMSHWYFPFVIFSNLFVLSLPSMEIEIQFLIRIFFLSLFPSPSPSLSMYNIYEYKQDVEKEWEISVSRKEGTGELGE